VLSAGRSLQGLGQCGATCRGESQNMILVRLAPLQ
jgi:hypothetical protein